MSDNYDLSDRCQHCVNCDCQEEYIGKLEEEVLEQKEEIEELKDASRDDMTLIQELDDEADYLGEELDRVEKERDQWRRSAEILRATIEDAICDGCIYDDDCPPNARHFRCASCTLREGLESAMGAWEMKDG